VVTEALYMLRKYPAKRDHLLQRLSTEELQVLPLANKNRVACFS
jgi:hypothetical protein